MKFASEPNESVVAGSSAPPRTLNDLLADLDVATKPKDVQRAAILDWLRHNEPDSLMRLGLRKLGITTVAFSAAPWIKVATGTEGEGIAELGGAPEATVTQG